MPSGSIATALICVLGAGLGVGALAAARESRGTQRKSAFDERCQPVAARLVAANRYARVYYTVRDEKLQYCRPAQRRPELAPLTQAAYPPPAISLAGPYLGYAAQANDGLQEVDNVVVVDVRRRDELLFTAGYRGGVGSLKVNRRGSVAWIECPFGYLVTGQLQCTQSGAPETGRAPRSIYRHDSRSTQQEPVRLVARSRRIQVRSLRRRGDRIYWTQGHQIRHASLR